MGKVAKDGAKTANQNLVKTRLELAAVINQAADLKKREKKLRASIKKLSKKNAATNAASNKVASVRNLPSQDIIFSLFPFVERFEQCFSYRTEAQSQKDCKFPDIFNCKECYNMHAKPSSQSLWGLAQQDSSFEANSLINTSLELLLKPIPSQQQQLDVANIMPSQSNEVGDRSIFPSAPSNGLTIANDSALVSIPQSHQQDQTTKQILIADVRSTATTSHMKDCYEDINRSRSSSSNSDGNGDGNSNIALLNTESVFSQLLAAIDEVEEDSNGATGEGEDKLHRGHSGSVVGDECVGIAYEQREKSQLTDLLYANIDNLHGDVNKCIEVYDRGAEAEADKFANAHTTINQNVNVNMGMHMEVESNMGLKYDANVNLTVKANEIVNGNSNKIESRHDFGNSDKTAHPQKTQTVPREHSSVSDNAYVGLDIFTVDRNLDLKGVERRWAEEIGAVFDVPIGGRAGLVGQSYDARVVSPRPASSSSSSSSSATHTTTAVGTEELMTYDASNPEEVVSSLLQQIEALGGGNMERHIERELLPLSSSPSKLERTLHLLERVYCWILDTSQNIMRDADRQTEDKQLSHRDTNRDCPLTDESKKNFYALLNIDDSNVHLYARMFSRDLDDYIDRIMELHTRLLQLFQQPTAETEIKMRAEAGAEQRTREGTGPQSEIIPPFVPSIIHLLCDSLVRLCCFAVKRFHSRLAAYFINRRNGLKNGGGGGNTGGNGSDGGRGGSSGMSGNYSHCSKHIVNNLPRNSI